MEVDNEEKQKVYDDKEERNVDEEEGQGGGLRIGVSGVVKEK
jgi:hypothetical protein